MERDDARRLDEILHAEKSAAPPQPISGNSSSQNS